LPASQSGMEEERLPFGYTHRQQKVSAARGGTKKVSRGREKALTQTSHSAHMHKWTRRKLLLGLTGDMSPSPTTPKLPRTINPRVSPSTTLSTTPTTIARVPLAEITNQLHAILSTAIRHRALSLHCDCKPDRR
jgi:hypothetical protein